MKKLVVLVMMAFLVPAAAYAKNPCKDDKVKFCEDAKKAGTKMNDCLRQHENEISAACKEQLSKPKEGKPNKTEKDTKGKESGDATKSDNAPQKPAAGETTTGTPPAETKPAETAPSAPAAPGGAETKP